MDGDPSLERKPAVEQPKIHFVSCDADPERAPAIDGVRSGELSPRVELWIDGDAALFLRPEGRTLDQVTNGALSWVFGANFVVLGLVVLIAALATGNVGFELGFLLIAIGIFGIVFPKLAFHPATGDDEELVVLRTRRSVPSEQLAPGRSSPIKVVEGSDVAGIQLCECYRYSGRPRAADHAHPSGQMNLLLSAPSGSRVHVVTHANDWRLRRDAQRLAEFLDKPIFDHLPKPS